MLCHKSPLKLNLQKHKIKPILNILSHPISTPAQQRNIVKSPATYKTSLIIHMVGNSKQNLVPRKYITFNVQLAAILLWYCVTSKKSTLSRKKLQCYVTLYFTISKLYDQTHRMCITCFISFDFCYQSSIQHVSDTLSLLLLLSSFRQTVLYFFQLNVDKLVIIVLQY